MQFTWLVNYLVVFLFINSVHEQILLVETVFYCFSGEDFIGGTERKLDDTLEPLNWHKPETLENPIQNQLITKTNSAQFNSMLCNIPDVWRLVQQFLLKNDLMSLSLNI